MGISLKRTISLVLRENLWQNSELTRRHQEKVVQALENPFGFNAYAVICAFSPVVHLIRFSYHRWEE